LRLTSSRRFAPWLAALVLSGCALKGEGNLFGVIAPYRAEVVQGNVVTQEMLAALRPGLTRDQVRATLGSPLLADAFHADRWDYVFTIRRQGTVPQQRRVSVFFTGDRLARHEADALPSERDFVASIDAARVDRSPPALQLTEAQLRALPPARAVAPAAEAASGPLRRYPPLEAATAP
jgi:outer membrane protein assembly factor BamE